MPPKITWNPPVVLTMAGLWSDAQPEVTGTVAPTVPFALMRVTSRSSVFGPERLRHAR